MESAQVPAAGPGLTHGEILRVVNRYIGVSGGYLGDFTYGTVCSNSPR
jgi:hypothetical protein